METKFFDVHVAIVYLKEGALVKSSNNYIFRLANDKIIGFNDFSRYVLNEEEFKQLYQEYKFYIVEDNGAIIDSKKDEEYYSFKHK